MSKTRLAYQWAIDPCEAEVRDAAHKEEKANEGTQLFSIAGEMADFVVRLYEQLLAADGSRWRNTLKPSPGVGTCGQNSAGGSRCWPHFLARRCRVSRNTRRQPALLNFIE